MVATLGYWRQLNNGTVNCISSAEFGDIGTQRHLVIIWLRWAWYKPHLMTTNLGMNNGLINFPNVS